MDIGSALHEARNRRGLTLPQVAQATKVPATVLEHIEHNRFERLPGAVFTKGYLRAFAACVGADGEQLVQEFVRQQGPAAPAAAAVSHPIRTEPSFRMTGPVATAVLCLAAAAVALYFALDLASRPAAAPAVVSDLPLPVATAGAVAPAAPEPAEAWPVQMEMTVSGDCWVSVTVDGQSAVYRLVRGGERISVRANNDVLLRVGDPTVFSYSLNGVPGRPIGRPGAPATVRINRDTYRELLQRPPQAPALGVS